jgi:hypothetical protein
MLQCGAHAVELSGDINGKRAIPFFRWNFVNASGWTGDAGIVDETI